MNRQTKTETKTHTEPDGTVIKTITTTVTQKHPDGKTSVQKTVKTIREKDVQVDPKTGKKTTTSIKDSMKKAERVPNTTEKKFINQCLARHNELRQNHGSPPLAISEDLNEVAQGWANQCASSGEMEHSPYGFGENIFWASAPVSAKRAVDAWYSEIKKFPFGGRVDHKPGTGHFTQVVWNDTKNLGVATATGPKGFYVVCEYDPPGNFMGKFPENVKRPKVRPSVP